MTENQTASVQIIDVDPNTLASNVHNPRGHFRDLDRLRDADA